MTIGPVIWFMPAWYMAAFHGDTSAWEVMNMGNKIKEATFLVFVKKTMPVGMVGLMMSAMFAATMSSMDSALNRNAGIFVKNFYSKFINRNADEKQELVVGKIVTTIFGILIIVTGLFLNSLKDLSLFNAMMYVSTLISVPLLLPTLLGFFVKKTPDWAAWGTLLVGLIVSYVASVVITPEMVQNMLGLEVPFTKREAADLTVVIGMLGHIIITGGFFVCSQFFYKGLTPEREKEVEEFFKRVDTPVVVDDSEIHVDNSQRAILGKLIKVFGLSALVLCLVPNPIEGRIVYLVMAGILYGIGYALVKAVEGKKRKIEEKVKA